MYVISFALSSFPIFPKYTTWIIIIITTITTTTIIITSKGYPRICAARFSMYYYNWHLSFYCIISNTIILHIVFVTIVIFLCIFNMTISLMTYVLLKESHFIILGYGVNSQCYYLDWITFSWSQIYVPSSYKYKRPHYIFLRKIAKRQIINSNTSPFSM